MSTDYSWIKLHNEISQYILDNFKDNHKGLIETLKAIGETKNLTDKSVKGKEYPLEDIDPFTFLSFFNKYSNPINRGSQFRKLKAYWKLKSAVPTEYLGVPTMYGQKVWLFAYSYERKNNDISILWKLFDQTVANNIDEDIFNAALKIKQTGITALTQHMFCVSPNTYLPFDVISHIIPWTLRHDISC